jgi:hypothetical protein
LSNWGGRRGIDDELRKLRRENVLLRAEVERLRLPPLPPPTLGGPWRVPDRAQIERLTSIVLTGFPCLHWRKDRAMDAGFYAAVEGGLLFLGTVNRLPEGQVDARYSERWCDPAQQWSTRNGLGLQFDPYSFHVAVVAAGDIDFYDPSLVGHGGCVCFGLRDGVGRAPRNQWLVVLETGRVREPVPPPRLYEDWLPGRQEIFRPRMWQR